MEKAFFADGCLYVWFTQLKHLLIYEMIPQLNQVFFIASIQPQKFKII